MPDGHEIISETFLQVDSLLKIDHGKFWNHQLHGPIIMVHPETRMLYANQNNKSNTFTKTDDLYVGTLPKELNIANTALNWDNERWTMILLPLPTDKTTRNSLVIHELFHRIQPEIGFDNLPEPNNGHLDTYEGRTLLKLELEALKDALDADNESQRNIHLKNALIFRDKRQSSEERKAAENSLEINEGMAEYTALMLGGRNKEETKQHLLNSIDQFYLNPTFVRSFAYQTVPVYGYLLSSKNKNWHQAISKDTDLTHYFINSFAIEIPKNVSYENVANENSYNYKNI